MRLVAIGLLVLMTLALCAQRASGYFGRQVIPSVETMVGYADGVVIGKIISVEPAPRGRASRFEVVVQTLETLKGEDRRPAIGLGVMDDQPWRSCVRGGGEVVLFLTKE